LAGKLYHKKKGHLHLWYDEIMKKKTPKQLALPFLLPLLLLSLILNLFFIIGPTSLLDRFDKLTAGRLRTSSDKEELEGTVVRVIDGDTFDLEEGVRVRLAGAEAPEYPEGCLSSKVKERLEELILGKEVGVEVIEEDSFGRKVGFVIENNLLIDKTMVEEGLARAASGENPRYGADLLSAEDSAKKAERGIWSSLCAGKENCLIKGNVRKDLGTKVYHLPECYNYEKIVVNEREGDQWFCTEGEAQKAGFRKSEDCP